MNRVKRKLFSVISILLSIIMLISVINLPAFKAKAAAGTVDDFVERCYTVTLDRGSDPDGFADWKDQLLNGRAVGIEVAYGFLFSPEYTRKNKDNDAYLKDLYMLFMGREPDESGYNDWMGKLNSGVSRLEVFAGFANSQEFYNICESYGITAGRYVMGYDRKTINNVNLYVERMYKICLGRIGDKDGQKNWVEKLITKQISGSECARSFIFSKEYTNLGLSDEAFVENLYLAMFGRPSDADGKNNWLYGLKNGMTRDEVFAGFANSVEFDNICKAYGIDRGTYTATNKGTFDKDNPNNVPVTPEETTPENPTPEEPTPENPTPEEPTPEEPTPTHTHNYNKKNTKSKYLKSAATCTKAAEYYYSCECGEKGTATFTSGNPKGHKYNQKKTASKYLKSVATCTEPAIYYYSCECGAYNPEHVFSSGNPLGHDMDEGTVIKEATLTEYGTKIYQCKHSGCTETITENIPSLIGQANVGDIIKYGKYEQDGDITNGKEDIEWQILSNQAGRVLVISKYVLDSKEFNDVSEEVTWETSSLRTWLNGEFMEEVFSDTEKESIPKVLLENKSIYPSIPNGNSTEDYVFCLSMEDINTYFGEHNLNLYDGYQIFNEKLICAPTEQAINNGARCYVIDSDVYESLYKPSYNYSSDVIGREGCLWWLRTHGGYYDSNCTVNYDGEAGRSCNHRVDYSMGVRPAMYIEYTTHSEHIYNVENTDRRYIKIPASCTEPAVYYYSCECGEYDSEHTFISGNPLGHLWDEGMVTEPATLIEDGIKIYHCKNAGCTETKTEIIPSLSHTSVRDIIKYGNYEQDGDDSNGKEDIEWRVLSKEGGRVLVISEYGLDVKKYDTNGGTTTWETSSLRTWLNSDFINDAFTGEEKIRIPKVTLENHDNTYYDLPGGNATEDYVFCLSIDEINTYFGEHNWISSDGSSFANENLICTPTQWAINEGAKCYTITSESYENYKQRYNYSPDVIDRKGCTWWLRTPAVGGSWTCIVNDKGVTGEGGGNYESVSLKSVVRPAMYIDYTIHPEHEFTVESTDERYLKSAATCIEPAVYYYSCECGAYDSDHTFTYGSPIPHSFTVQNTDDRYLRGPATHQHPASYYYSCECGEMDITQTFEYGSPIPHEFIVENTADMYLKSAATHAEPAIYYYSCECGEIDPDHTFSYGNPIPHEFSIKSTDSKYLKSAATCTDNAVYYYSCECGEYDPNHTFEKARSSLGHRYMTQSTDSAYLKSAATCTEPAVYYYKCVRCAEHSTATFTYGEPLGHDYSDLTITKEPTFTECGKKTGYCERCGGTVTESIPCLLSQANVGDIIKFGKYEQDGDDTNGKEDIEWQVLSQEDGRALVISKDILDIKKYDTNNSGTTWENSQLRNWLNNDFMNEAFSTDEKLCIPEVTLENKNNSVYNTPGGNDTEDYVFCLSFEEAEHYFGEYNWHHDELSYGNSQKLMAYPTQKVVNDNIDTFVFGSLYMTDEMYEQIVGNTEYADYSTDIIGHYMFMYWLRTPGEGADYACFVGPLGNIGEENRSLNQGRITDMQGVRPAMYIEYETE